MIENDIITPSTSEYNSCAFVVPKKSPDGKKKYRLVIDFRKLNELTVTDNFPLPMINEILLSLGGSKYFSTCDLAQSFYQILLDPETAHKSAFSSDYQKWEFKRLPMGLKNSPACLMRALNNILSGMQGIDLFVYMDDLVIYSESLSEHYRKLKRLLCRLQQAGLTLQPEKCNFLRREVVFLGHKITAAGVIPDPSKTSSIDKYPRPKDAKGVKSSVGLCSFYRRHIAGFAKIARDLSILLRKGEKFEWTEKQEEAF